MYLWCDTSLFHQNYRPWLTLVSAKSWRIFTLFGMGCKSSIYVCTHEFKWWTLTLCPIFTQTSTESSIDSFIRMEVAQVVREKCQCDFQESFISQAVLFCDQQEPTQIVYRAIIASYGNYSADQLVGYIEDWVIQGAIITSGLVVAKFDPDCPVRINISDPVCGHPSTSAVTSHSTSTISMTSASTVLPSNTLSSASSSWTAIVITTASVAVIIVTVVTVVVVVILIVVLHYRKKKK